MIESDTERVESDEYEFEMRATATLDGPEGRVSVRRQYDALPYHNDVVYPEGADSNDQRLDRPDEIHVHTRYHAVNEEPEYVGDRHETWRPERASAFGDPDELAALCTNHHLADPVTLYREATERR